MTEATERSAEQGLTDQMSAKAQDAVSTVQEKASDLREQGSTRLRDQFDRRSNEAGSQVRSLAQALRRSSTDLSADGNTGGARLAEQAADRAEQVGSYLERRSGDELMRDVELFARRRPWMLAGLGVIAGVAAARFLKASSEQRYRDSRRLNQQQGRGHQGTATAPGAPYRSAEVRTGGFVADEDVAASKVPSTPRSDLAAQNPAGTR